MILGTNLPSCVKFNRKPQKKFGSCDADEHRTKKNVSFTI